MDWLEVVQSIGPIGWSGVSALALALLGWILATRRSRGIEREKAKAAATERSKEAREAYMDALATGTAEEIVLRRKGAEKARKAVDALLVVSLLMLSACRTAETKTEYVPVGGCVIFPKAGETVPELPNGESRWILLSAPTGCRLILGEDYGQ